MFLFPFLCFFFFVVSSDGGFCLHFAIFSASVMLVVHIQLPRQEKGEEILDHLRVVVRCRGGMICFFEACEGFCLSRSWGGWILMSAAFLTFRFLESSVP